jgi:hypothetical protein
LTNVLRVGQLQRLREAHAVAKKQQEPNGAAEDVQSTETPHAYAPAVIALQKEGRCIWSLIVCCFSFLRA